MSATTEAFENYQDVTNETGRVFRVGETPRDILGYGRWVPIMAAWLAMCLAGLLEYTWGALNGSLAAVHGWGPGPMFWAFSFFVIFESFVQIFTGILRNRGILNVRWATIIGGIVCGIVGYGLLATSTVDLAGLPRVRGARRHRLRDGLLELHQHRGQVVPGEEGLADRVRQRRLGLRRRARSSSSSARPAAAAAPPR